MERDVTWSEPGPCRPGGSLSDAAVSRQCPSRWTLEKKAIITVLSTSKEKSKELECVNKGEKQTS